MSENLCGLNRLVLDVMKMDMKISDMIKKLKEIESEHGNLLVVLPSNEETILVTIRDEDFLICHDGNMRINDFTDHYIDELDDRKVLVFGEWWSG